MKPTPSLRSFLLGSFFFTATPLLHATPYYWDTDDTTAGFGNTAGTWGTNTFWSTVATGTGSSANTTITSSDGVNFGASTLALGSTASTIGIVAGGVTTNSITFGSAQATAITLSSGGGNITLAGTTPTITVDNTSDTIGAILIGSAGMIKAGNGSLALTGINTYTGNTTINGGTLDISSLAGRIYNGVTGQVVTVNTGGLMILRNMAAGSLGNLNATAANLVVNGGTIRTTEEGSSRGRAITVGANGATFEVNNLSGYVMGYVLTQPNVYTANSTFTLSGNGSATITKKITGTGVSVVKDGSGTWIVSPDAAVTNNDYTGATHIKAGTLRVGLSAGGQALGNGSAVTLDNVSGATLNLNGFSQTVGSLAGGGITGGNITLGANATLTAGGNNTSTTYAGAISGTGTSGLTKTGAGTLTLTNTSSYSGNTAVSNGALIVNGNISTSLLTTVASAATLGGGGTVGALSFNGGALFDIFQAIESSNPLDSTTITFSSSGFGIDNLVDNGIAIDWTTVDNGIYTLINGTLDNTNLGNFGLANAYDIDGGSGDRSAYFQSGSLQLVVIPEPRAALLGGLGMLMLLRRRRN